jgi:hypothetical protein
MDYGNLKSENSQDYAQRPQQNCTFMNSATVHTLLPRHKDSTLFFTFSKQLVFLTTLLRIYLSAETGAGRARHRSFGLSLGKTSMIITTDDFCVSISLI